MAHMRCCGAMPGSCFCDVTPGDGPPPQLPLTPVEIDVMDLRRRLSDMEYRSEEHEGHVLDLMRRVSELERRRFFGEPHCNEVTSRVIESPSTSMEILPMAKKAAAKKSTKKAPKKAAAPKAKRKTTKKVTEAIA